MYAYCIYTHGFVGKSPLWFEDKPVHTCITELCTHLSIIGLAHFMCHGACCVCVAQNITISTYMAAVNKYLCSVKPDLFTTGIASQCLLSELRVMVAHHTVEAMY
jgi:hypothetical protein